MIPGKKVWKPLVQKAVTGKSEKFLMTQAAPDWPTSLSSPGLYLHVPFCRNLCPYCPYNRIKYDDELFLKYLEAVKREVDLYAPYIKNNKFVSFYIGGGTPTVNWIGLVEILKHFRTCLTIDCDICIELHPANMDEDCLTALKDLGINMLSIGVESTSDDILERIGRSHDSKAAIDAVERALKIGFESVNVDLMFALPGQSLDDWKYDVSTMVSSGVDQISTYPMFSFPYSDLGKERKLSRVTRPQHKTVKKMLNFADDYCEEHGLKRCAVWSWLKPEKLKFSSITRHHYIGFGPSAASMTGKDFYVNTFDVNSYSECLPGKRPVAVSMRVNKKVEMAYWLYWRVYELKINNTTFQNLFGTSQTLKSEFGHLLFPFEQLGMVEFAHGNYSITRKGAYWIHRLQNEYSLNYINNLWGTCRKEPWPEKVLL